MKLNQKSLQELCSVHSVTGDTLEITEYLQRRLKQLGLVPKQNGFGVVLFGNTKNPQLMVSAHADEVGFQVVKKNDDGTFLVTNSGHISPVMLNNTNVYVQTPFGQVVGAFYHHKELGNNSIESFTEIYLDTLDNEKVQIGNFGSYNRVFHSNESKIIATGLDNKVGVELILELVKENPELLKTTLFCFVTEEESSYDCIAGIAHQYNPEFAIVVDMFPVNQINLKKVESIPQINHGPAILFAMKSYHLHPVLKEIITSMKISYQPTFVDIDFPPEPQIVQKNGTTKGINVFIPMYGWHNSTYTMYINDFEKTKVFVYQLYQELLMYKK